MPGASMNAFLRRMLERRVKKESPPPADPTPSPEPKPRLFKKAWSVENAMASPEGLTQSIEQHDAARRRILK
jgi:hypothetical protein